MGDRSTLAKAKKELEELYLGVPDDSVNLTFQDLAEVRQLHSEKKSSHPMDSTSESRNIPKTNAIPANSPSLTKIPSLDFNRALEASSMQQNHHRSAHHVVVRDDRVHAPSHGHHRPDEGRGRDLYSHGETPLRHAGERSVFYDDVSQVSGYSVSSLNPYHERGGRRRPGIPHSKICTVCSTYIYIFRHRCLVCGRVYCRQCVNIGMGEMAEGRKCIECLGRRFSQRYIQRAGNVGCCMGYPSKVKQQELKWAEKGPRRSGENRYGAGGRSGMVSTSRSPMTPRTPTRAYSPSTPPSFVMGSPYSPYSPTTHHALPF
ncbi:Hypothetical predicted protein [Olea europaea subsp. europaea]|uniref:Uncharacterized protein n=1 Tax=Olea europaea subsp. europaea TaxID=158383 RepID=A0A8S0UDL5_OLEEU|nr:Hypothetical predicted protein [Olea europaea subsp. europaea]